MLEIKKLTVDDGDNIYDMLQEIPAEENGFGNSVNGMSIEQFKGWLEKSAKSSEQKEIIDGWKVPQTTYWLYEDGIPVGMGKIRHFLTDALKTAGGHIGYAIRPSARGRGLGKAQLKLLISEARKIGIGDILITVREDNTASLKVALANGGVLEKTENERHYIWINRTDDKNDSSTV